MRRAILLLTAMVVVLVLGAGVALAVSGAFTGTNANETINGSSGQDRIAGGGGSDTIDGRGDNDQLYGDFGVVDNLKGVNGHDFLNVADTNGGDKVDGGGGFDTCVVDPGDTIVTTSGGTTTVPAPTSPDPTGTTCEAITIVGQ